MSSKDRDVATSTGDDGGTAEKNQPARSPEEIQADIEQTREQLGQSVDALSAKLDVKTRARNRVATTRQQASDQVQHARRRATEAATDDQGSLKPAVPAAGGAAVLVLLAVGVLVWRRRR